MSETLPKVTLKPGEWVFTRKDTDARIAELKVEVRAEWEKLGRTLAAIAARRDEDS